MADMTEKTVDQAAIDQRKKMIKFAVIIAIIAVVSYLGYKFIIRKL
jgi:hypothetical protein